MERKYIITIGSIYLLIAVANVIFTYIGSVMSSWSLGIIIAQFFNIFEYLVITLIFISIYFTYNFNLHKAVLFGFLGSIFKIITISYGLIDYFSSSFSFTLFSFSIENILIIRFVILGGLLSINIYLVIIMKKHRSTDKKMIKKTIIDLGTKFTNLHVKEISQKTKSEKNNIINVIKEMIKNKEIHAEYFSNTNIVAFDQSANIEDIDNLMAQFAKNEEKNIGKV